MIKKLAIQRRNMSLTGICHLYYHIRGAHRVVAGSDNTKCNWPTAHVEDLKNKIKHLLQAFRILNPHIVIYSMNV